MSSSAEFWDLSGRKPSFSQTCSRLSRYLKEKGSFGDLTLGMTCKPDLNGKQPLDLFSFDSGNFLFSCSELRIKNRLLVAWKLNRR